MMSTPSPRMVLEARPHSPWTACRQRKKNRTAVASDASDEEDYASTSQDPSMDSLWNGLQRMCVTNKVRWVDGVTSGGQNQQQDKQTAIFWPTSMSIQELKPKEAPGENQNPIAKLSAACPSWADGVHAAGVSLSADPGAGSERQIDSENAGHEQPSKRRSWLGSDKASESTPLQMVTNTVHLPSTVPVPVLPPKDLDLDTSCLSELPPQRMHKAKRQMSPYPLGAPLEAPGTEDYSGTDDAEAGSSGFDDDASDSDSPGAFGCGGSSIDVCDRLAKHHGTAAEDVCCSVSLDGGKSDDGCLADYEFDDDGPHPGDSEFRILSILGGLPHGNGHPPTPASASGVGPRCSARRMHQLTAQHPCDEERDVHSARVSSDRPLIADGGDFDDGVSDDEDHMDCVALKLMYREADFLTPTQSPQPGPATRQGWLMEPDLFSSRYPGESSQGLLDSLRRGALLVSTPRELHCGHQEACRQMDGQAMGCGSSLGNSPLSRGQSPWDRHQLIPVEQLSTLDEFNEELCVAAYNGDRGRTSMLWIELCNQGIIPNLKTLNHMMKCLAKSMAHPEEAEKLAREVCQVGCLSPNPTTYNLLAETRLRYEQLCGFPL